LVYVVGFLGEAKKITTFICHISSTLSLAFMTETVLISLRGIAPT
jgi:hypothetical protein